MPNVTLEDGTVVQFARSSEVGDFGAQGLGDKVESSMATIGEIGAKVVGEIVSKIRKTLVSAAPDELEIGIGLSVAQEGTVIVTSGKAEANVTITATWKRA